MKCETLTCVQYYDSDEIQTWLKFQIRFHFTFTHHFEKIDTFYEQIENSKVFENIV